MSDTLESIKRLRAELRRKLELIPEFREYEVLGRTLADLKAIASGERVQSLAEAMGTPDEFDRALRAAMARPAQPSNSDLCVERIATVNLPQTTGELTAFLEEQGRPAKSLVSSLSRDDRLISISWVGNKAWWINGAVLPREPNSLLEIGVQEDKASEAEDLDFLK